MNLPWFGSASKSSNSVQNFNSSEPSNKLKTKKSERTKWPELKLNYLGFFGNKMPEYEPCTTVSLPPKKKKTEQVPNFAHVFYLNYIVKKIRLKFLKERTKLNLYDPAGNIPSLHRA